VPVETPRIRQQGKGEDRKFQWMFGDGKWRDMVPDLDMEDFEGVFGSTHLLWDPDHAGQWRERNFFDLVAMTNIFPDYFKESTASSYAAVLGTLWGEVTGIDPDNIQWTKYKGLKANAPMPGYNWDRREGTWQQEKELLPEGSPEIGVTWNEASQIEMAQYMAEASEATAAEHNWSAIAANRGYDIDFSDPQASFQFLSRAQNDLDRGRIYTDYDNYKDLDIGAPFGPREATDQERREAMPTSPTNRKVVAEYDSESMANMAAQSIPNANVEPSDGKWVVTVPPGQGGWESEEDAQKWLDQTSGENAGNFEVAPGTEGQWYVREKTPDRAYSTPTRVVNGEIIPGTPGDMFEPTITEDPTGRRFGLDASGNLTDFGYGMAGDITQEELAGYQVPHRSLDMIVAKAIEQGNWDLARGVQAFIDRPTERELLEFAAQYAESPADLAVLSAIARGETLVQPGTTTALSGGGFPISSVPEGMGTGMGQVTRIGAPAEEYQSAYKQFKDAMDLGFDPTLPENQEALQALFDPKNDPVYVATQELANKYETQIGNLRNEIAEANKSASERIENTQTNTMNMMTGLFGQTIDSFKEVLEKTTQISDAEIDRLTNQINDMRTSTFSLPSGGDGDVISDSAVQPGTTTALSGGGFPISSVEGRGERVTRLNKEFMAQMGFNPNEKNPYTEGMTFPEMEAWLTNTAPGVVKQHQISEAKQQTFQDFEEYQQDPGQEQFANIATNVPGQAATESQFVYQTADKDWGGREEREKPLEQQSWQAQYFAPQVAAEQQAHATGRTSSGEVFVDPWEFEGAEGGVVQGPTVALLGEKEPEFIVPFSKVDEFKNGFLPLGPSQKTRRGSTVAKFEDAIPRFANGGLVTGPRFGGVTARGLEQYGDTGAYVTPETRKELDLGAEGRYGANGISRAPRVTSSDFESLLTQYAEPESRRYLREGTTALGQQGYRDEATRATQMGNIPEYELRHRLGASEFAGTNPAQHPIGIQQLMAGRPISRPQSLMTAANMPTPSGQALRNMLPSELAYYQKLGRMAGIPQQELEREMRSVMPGGTRRTPLRMGARRVRQA
jgi:hypothetical protein